jgi:glutathione S-transferase
MTLKLYMHPLSSYCHKALIAFYENGIAFEEQRISDPQAAAELKAKWPVMKFPALMDTARDTFVPEASIIIEYLDQHYPGKTKLIPADPDRARQVRFRDRFFDNYLHTPMQKLAFDQRRPEESRDPFGVNDAREAYRTALDMVERDMAHKTWSTGDAFTMADCAAAPALYYGNRLLLPFDKTHPNATAYLGRLLERSSYARALKEAEPFFQFLPKPAN